MPAKTNQNTVALESTYDLQSNCSTSAGVDEAWKFLETHQGEIFTTDEDLRAIRGKIDCRIYPWLAACVLMQNLDKFSLNVSWN